MRRSDIPLKAHPAFVGGPLMVALVLAATVLPRTSPAQTPRRRATPASEKGVTSTPGVKVRLWVGKDDRNITLNGFSREHVYYPKSGAVRAKLAKSEVSRVAFDLDLYSPDRSRAERRRDWLTLIRIISPQIKPTLPYLDLPDNNAAEPALELGTIMMRAADRTTRLATTDEQRERARKQYESAATILNDVALATWSPVGALANLKRCRCLLAINKPKTTAYYLDPEPEPFPGDAAFGMYWIVQGELAFLKKDYRTAMDAAVKSVAFENKDVETFPDALLLTGRCYEHFQEWYRARDVYFEVASIFPQTDWADDAAERLQYILDEKHTEEEETSPLENVFFGLTEDVNELARELLKRRREERDDEDEPEETGPPEE